MNSINQIYSLFDKKKSFLAARIPGYPVQIFYPSNESGWQVCLSNFDKSEKIYFSNVPGEANTKPTQPALPYCSSFEDYEKQFGEIQRNIGTGKISKAILSRIMSLDETIDSPVELFRQLESNYPDACVHLLSINGTIWLGATPELLASQKNGNTSCASLAGTLALNDQNWTQKEIEEQKIVSDFIAAKFDQYGQLTEQLGPKDKIAGEVRHLYTKLTGKIDDYQRFIDDLHPTPAISGFPQSQAIEAIQSIETHNRDWYTGYLRFKMEDADLAYVNLRCMQIINSKPFLYLGGGITKDSVLEKEWKETEMKAQTLRSVMQKL